MSDVASARYEPDLAATFAALRDSPVAEEARAYVDTLSRRRAKRRQAAKAAQPLGVALAVLLVVGGLGALPRGAAVTPAPAIYATRTGQIRTLLLEDGSKLTLDTASRVAVLLGRDARRLTLLEGRAAFDVAHDAARPFSVASGRMTVTAIGTHFTVTALPRDHAVRLLRGRVRVEASQSSPVMLAPGEEVALRGDARLAAVRTTPRIDPLAWERGEIEFRDVTVSEALAEANRYSKVKIELRDAAVADRRIDGLFRAGDSRALIRSLCASFDLRVVAEGEEKVVLG